MFTESVDRADDTVDMPLPAKRDKAAAIESVKADACVVILMRQNP